MGFIFCLFIVFLSCSVTNLSFPPSPCSISPLYFSFTASLLITPISLSLFIRNAEELKPRLLSWVLIFYTTLTTLSPSNSLPPSLFLFSHLHMRWRWEKRKIRCRLARAVAFLTCTRSLSGSTWPSFLVSVCVHACHGSFGNVALSQLKPLSSLIDSVVCVRVIKNSTGYFFFCFATTVHSCCFGDGTFRWCYPPALTWACHSLRVAPHNKNFRRKNLAAHGEK